MRSALLAALACLLFNTGFTQTVALTQPPADSPAPSIEFSNNKISGHWLHF